MFYGGYLVYSEGIHYKVVFKVAEALILGKTRVLVHDRFVLGEKG